MILGAIEAVAIEVAVVDGLFSSYDLARWKVSRAFGAENFRLAGCDQIARNELEVVHFEVVDARLVAGEERREF